MKGPKDNFLGTKSRHVAKEDGIKYSLLTESHIDTISNKRKIKGQLKKRLLGVAELRPRVRKGETQEEEKKEREQNKITIEEINRAIQPPAFIQLEDDRKDPKDRRVSKPDEWLHKKIMELFLNQKPEWKLEEVERELDHPKAGVLRMLQKLCKIDHNTKKYTLQKQYIPQ